MDKDNVWKAFQKLNLGADQAPLRISSAILAEEKEKRSRSLIVKGLNPTYQNPRYMKVLLPEMWRLADKVNGQVLEDGNVQFFFDSERDLVNILDGGPWNFSDWLMVMDRWSNRNDPNFLKLITMWVQIEGLPDNLRSESVAMDIGESLGRASEAYVREPSTVLHAMVKVKVTMPVTAKLIFSRPMDLENEKEPLLLIFVYERLRKFCRNCGALTHATSSCSGQNVRRDAALVGESSRLADKPSPLGAVANRPLSSDSSLEARSGEEIESLQRGKNIHKLEKQVLMNDSKEEELRKIEESLGYGDGLGALDCRGAKRKLEEMELEGEGSSGKAKKGATADNDGLVVYLKPPSQP